MTILQSDWHDAIIKPSATIGQAIYVLNQCAIKIVLVVNDIGALEGTISDGDIRRALLKGLSMNSPIESIIHRNVLVVPPEMKREFVKQLMVSNKIQQIPVVDSNRRVLALHQWDDIAIPIKRENFMVIMAGGKGVRLLPHTKNCPKPMLLIGDKPMLQCIIERAKSDGFVNFVISIHYLGHMIEEYFGDGSNMGVQIEYLKEDAPLGTAGALALLKSKTNKTFIVTNGDVITDIRYGELLEFHEMHNAIGTMAVRLYESQNPFGVVEMDGIDITGFTEKPVTRSHINAGVYALDPVALNLLALGESCDMPSLFTRLQNLSRKIIAYPMYEPWLDVGRPDDLLTANKI